MNWTEDRWGARSSLRPMPRCQQRVAEYASGIAAMLLAIVPMKLPAQSLTITNQPASHVPLTGSRVAFRVGEAGTGGLTYQWQFNGTNTPNSIIIATAAGPPLGDGVAATNAENSNTVLRATVAPATNPATGAAVEAPTTNPAAQKASPGGNPSAAGEGNTGGKEEKTWVTLLAAVLPALLSPIVVWILARPTASAEAARIDYLIKRLDLHVRLSQIRGERRDDGLDALLESEIANCYQVLSRKPNFIHSIEEHDKHQPTSILGKFFLTGPSATVRQRVFKGLFYFFLVVSLCVLAAAFESEPGLPISLFVSAFYFIIAVLCRLPARPRQAAQ